MEEPRSLNFRGFTVKLDVRKLRKHYSLLVQSIEYTNRQQMI